MLRLLEQVVEVMSKQDRALRMPAGVGEQLVDGAGRVEAVGGEQSLDVASGLGDRQGRKLKRPGLPVEGSLLLGKQRVHERWLAAGEHVGGGLAVMLDDGAHQTVDRVIGDQNLLELVEADNREFAVCAMERTWHVQQLEQSSAGLVGWGARRPRGYADPDPGNRGSDFETCRPTANAASWIGRQVAVGAGDARRHVAQRRDLREVDAHRTMAGFAHGKDVGIQQAALAKAARGGELRARLAGSPSNDRYCLTKATVKPPGRDAPAPGRSTRDCSPCRRRRR